MNNETRTQPLLHLILIAVALAMGVVTIVLSILDAAMPASTFLAIGVTALALHQLIKQRT